MTHEESEPEQCYGKMRIQGRMFKNFRTQLTPLAQSPPVSNIRSPGVRLRPRNPPRNEAIRKAPTMERLARQQPSQKQQISCAPDSEFCSSPCETSTPKRKSIVKKFTVPKTTVTRELIILPANLWRRSYHTTTDWVGAKLRSNPAKKEKNVATLTLSSLQVLVNDGKRPAKFGPRTVVSEPLWTAMSDTASVHTVETAPPLLRDIEIQRKSSIEPTSLTDDFWTPESKISPLSYSDMSPWSSPWSSLVPYPHTSRASVREGNHETRFSELIRYIDTVV